MKRSIVGVAIAATAAVCAAPAHGDTRQFHLKDRGMTVGGHKFGLRFDNLFRTANSTNSGFSNAGGFTTFSLNEFADTVMTVNKTGNSITINISGTVVGGRANSAGLVNGLGKGKYALNMTYTANIQQGPNGWRVAAASAQNQGSLRALDGVIGVAEGTTWTFGDERPAGSSSLTFFKNGGAPVWVGNGWLLAPISGTQQMVFTGSPTLIPLPAGLWAGAAGLAGLGAFGFVRRRRAAE